MSVPHDINFLTLKNALDWFDNQSHANNLFHKKIRHSILTEKTKDIPNNFKFLSLEQAKQQMDENAQELNLVSCFLLISAAEGCLKYDFQLKVENSLKSNLCKDFRTIFSENEKNMKHIDIQRDILEIWKKHYPSTITTKYIGSFKKLINLRNWLAHGRFLMPNRLGRHISQYHPDLVYKETKALFDHLKNFPEQFHWE